MFTITCGRGSPDRAMPRGAIEALRCPRAVGMEYERAPTRPALCATDGAGEIDTEAAAATVGGGGGAKAASAAASARTAVATNTTSIVAIVAAIDFEGTLVYAKDGRKGRA